MKESHFQHKRLCEKIIYFSPTYNIKQYNNQNLCSCYLRCTENWVCWQNLELPCKPMVRWAFVQKTFSYVTCSFLSENWAESKKFTTTVGTNTILLLKHNNFIYFENSSFKVFFVASTPRSFQVQTQVHFLVSIKTVFRIIIYLNRFGGSSRLSLRKFVTVVHLCW